MLICTDGVSWKHVAASCLIDLLPPMVPCTSCGHLGQEKWSNAVQQLQACADGLGHTSKEQVGRMVQPGTVCRVLHAGCGGDECSGA